MPKNINPLEEDIEYLAEVWVELVQELVEELAPKGPWWSQKLTTDQQLWRYLETRDEMLLWIAEVGSYIFPSWEETLKHLEDLWFTMKPIDMVPPEILAKIPVSLLELVQSAPVDAAKHIRAMEKALERRSSAAPEEAEVPEVAA